MKLPFKINLENKCAVVTGGGGVICAALAEALAECGASVAILDLSKEAADREAEKITAAGGVAKGYSADVLNMEALKGAYEQIKADFGECSLLINGAGGNHPKGTTTKEYFDTKDGKDVITFFDLDAEGVNFVFRLNFLGTLLPTQVFARDMAMKGEGNIINISSMNAFRPLTKIPAYSGAKAAVSNFTQWLAVHFAKCGVRVNAMAPGFFVTAQNKSLLFDEHGAPTPRTKKILSATPMERFGETDELIGTLLYLADDNASGFVSGVVIPIDGAFSAYSGV
jgi:NAD(P)-dependent dehydrogenase (short-subunit alcohol dehydrogenase family)